MKAENTIDTAVAVFPAIARVMRAVAGFAVMIGCLEGGILVQRQLHIPVPGSVLGLVLLLVVSQTNIVPDGWVRGPCTWLLLLLPACFVPIYAASLSAPSVSTRTGILLLLTGISGVAVTLSLTGWIAWRTRQP